MNQKTPIMGAAQKMQTGRVFWRGDMQVDTGWQEGACHWESVHAALWQRKQQCKAQEVGIARRARRAEVRTVGLHPFR
jgi:hypothetical protein